MKRSNKYFIIGSYTAVKQVLKYADAITAAPGRKFKNILKKL